MSDSETIGFVGLGAMGIPMAQSLIRNGQQVLAYDIAGSARQRAGEEGIPLCRDGRHLGEACTVLITMLPNAEVVRTALFDDPGFVCQMPAGKLVVDMSSSYPPATRRLGAELAEIGLALIDAPVSGGVGRARSGKLTVMAGGSPDHVARAEPILAGMGQVQAVGALGNGHAMKALNNYVSAAGLIAACEALIVGQKFGLESETIIDILNISTGRNNSTETKLKQYVLNRDYDAGFAYSLMLKDVHAAAELGVELGLDEPMLQALVRILDVADTSLPADADHTRIHEWLERR